jgi:hypothetical protein
VMNKDCKLLITLNMLWDALSFSVCSPALLLNYRHHF